MTYLQQEKGNIGCLGLTITDGFPELTVNNIKIIESVLLIDSSYKHSSNTERGPLFINNQFQSKYNSDKVKRVGSTAFWVAKAKESINNNFKCVKYGSFKLSFNTIIKYLVVAIDNENSTHLNAKDINGREKITTEIIKNKEKLEDIAVNGIELLGKIRECVKGKDNYSFASKFIHYFAFYYYGIQDDRADSFSIYDSVLEKAIKKYCQLEDIKYNGIDFKNYVKYNNFIGELIKDKGISRNGFDHLLWYWFKGEQINLKQKSKSRRIR